MSWERSSHPCLRRGCRHPESEHLETPELAGPREIVVWCSGCQSHESRSSAHWFSDWRASLTSGLPGREFRGF